VNQEARLLSLKRLMLKHFREYMVPGGVLSSPPEDFLDLASHETFTEMAMLPVLREQLKVINDWMEDDQVEKVKLRTEDGKMFTSRLRALTEASPEIL